MFLSDLLINYQPKKPVTFRSPWNEMVGKFTDRLNLERKKDLWKRYKTWLRSIKEKDSPGNQAKFRKMKDVKTGYYEPYTYQYIAMKLADSKTTSLDDLYLFWGYCDDAQNFNKTFFWALRGDK